MKKGIVDRIVGDVVVVLVEEINVESTISTQGNKGILEGDLLNVELSKNNEIINFEVIDSFSQRERVDNIMARLRNRKSKFRE